MMKSIDFTPQVANVIPLYWTNEWVYGSWMCKVMKGTLEVGSLMSSGFFQLIAVERYFLIVYTFNVDKVSFILQTACHSSA